MRTTGTVEQQTDLNIKNWITERKMIGPDIDVTAPYIEREALPIPEMLFIKNPEEAAREVELLDQHGFALYSKHIWILPPKRI